MKTLFFLIILLSFGTFHSKSVIIANYHNILMFFPKELGGNDDVRVIFDVRNVTDGSVRKDFSYFLIDKIYLLN